MPSRTGLITLSGAPSQMLPLTRAHHACRWQPAHAHTPQHRTRNPCQVLHAHGLASSAIARHYTRNHKLFSSPTGTEMFHFPASTPTQTMHSPAGNTTQPVLGFPIRTSSDQRFVGNSPRHNAASHVLHRLSMPRHPPYALNNQTIIQHTQTHTTTQQGSACSDTQNTKTVLQTYKTKNPSQHHTPGTHKHAHQDAAKKKDARVHYTVLTQHTHTTTTTHAFTYGTDHPLRRTIPDASTDTRESCLQVAACTRTHPTTPHTQPLPGLKRTRFSLIRYRSPLHTESQLFSSPTGTEMFHFPASTPTQAMHSPAGNTTQPVLGFPIRTSSDQRFVGNSPRHNAASHVLHRLSMPRHPPYARNKTHGHTNNQGK